MKRMIAFFVDRGLLVNMVSIMLLFGGIYAASSIQREAFPPVNFDLLIVTSSYPGASPKEIEQLIINPIEREIKSIDGINTTRSTAYPGQMILQIEVDPENSDRSRLISDVQQAINRADLPTDLPFDPLITEIKSDQTPVISLSIYADREELDLKRISNEIEDDLLDISGVSQVIVQGERKEEIRITVDPEKAREQRVSVGDIIRLIQGWNVNAPGGTLKLPDGQKIIRIAGEFTSAEDAANLVIRANERGDLLRLKDISTVTHTLEKPWRYVDAKGIPAMNMIVLKKGDADIITLVDKVRSYLKTVPERYGQDIQVSVYNDFSINTRLRLNVLTSNGAIGLLFVVLTLGLFLRPSVALTTTWGLPIIFFSGLLCLFLYGTTLNLLTMFAFIIVLGLMVDDAIIIGENATYHMERGMTPANAAIHGTYELLGPVTATILTTIVAFLPMMFMSGIIGKFIAIIPLVVIVLLAFSWIEAIFILPNHIRDVADPRKHPKENRLLVLISESYERLLTRAVKHRYITTLATLGTLFGSLVLAAVALQFQLFPSGAENEFYLRLTGQNGMTLETMHKRVLELEKDVRAHIDPEILETSISVIGEYNADQREALNRVGDHYAYIRVILIPFTMRSTSVPTVMHQLEEKLTDKYQDLEINYSLQRVGPPTGRPLQVEITGGADSERKLAATRLIEMLKTVKGVHSIESDLDPGDPELHINIDRGLASYAQTDLRTVATHVKAAFDGIRVSTLKQGKEEVDVTIRYPEKAWGDPQTLKNLEIPNSRGGLIPLKRFASLEQKQGVNVIRHKNESRVINVAAEVSPEIITSQAVNQLVAKRQAEWLGDAANNGVEYFLGGEAERTEESVRGLVFSFLFALMGIFIILAIQFNRLDYPLLVMMAIPFGFIGVIIGLFLHGQPISFMSMMGFVALTGVVVNSSLVMVVFIQRLMQSGQHWFDAIIQGGTRRVRAVLLTATTTVVGLLPTAYGWGGFDPFVAPMALALSWGLIFSTFITLFSVPAALGIAIDIKLVLMKLWYHFRGKEHDRKIERWKPKAGQ